MSGVHRLLLLTPDQLSLDYPAAAAIDPGRDMVAQIEAPEDVTRLPSHKQRITLFLTAMRHFGASLQEAGYRCIYRALDAPDHRGSLRSELAGLIEALHPEALALVRPGDWRTLETIAEIAELSSTPLELLEDPHFLVTPEDFTRWAEGRKTLVLEHFYRWHRKQRGLLIDDSGAPTGGRWNFDAENRKPLTADSPAPPEPVQFQPDGTTREVMQLVEERFADSPGRLDAFGWGVTRHQALLLLADFVEQRLPHFGDYQDAMAHGRPWLFHSLLSPMLNLKLLDPRECIDAAIAAYDAGHAPINAVEGFLRQIIGWREFIRGVYWHEGPGYGERNHLEAEGKLPRFYWGGETDMVCVADALKSVLETGYGHHIQRLMVTGNLALTSGVSPQAISAWYLGMYVDSMDWVTLPNTAGMVMFADGGVVGSKPYASTGKYIQRMSDYCVSCRYDPGTRSGDDACPFTTFYWDFLIRNRSKLESVPRMRMMYRNVDRIDADEAAAIAARATVLREAWGIR
jgi:deoxyribodipyrimidine photolyase-related protein